MLFFIPPIIRKPEWLKEMEKKERERLLRSSNRKLLLYIIKKLDELEHKISGDVNPFK